MNCVCVSWMRKEGRASQRERRLVEYDIVERPPLFTEVGDTPLEYSVVNQEQALRRVSEEF